MKTSKQILKEKQIKKLEEIYDIYTLNDKIGKSCLANAKLKKSDLTPMDDEYFNQLRK